MRLGIFARTFAASGARPSLEAARNAGYEIVQFNMAIACGETMPATIAPQTCGEVAAASRSTGVDIAGVSGTYNMIHPDAGQRSDGMKRLKVLIAAAPAMGTGLVTLCTGTRNPVDQWAHHADNGSPEAWSDLVTEMEKAAAAAEASGVDLGIEPELANVVSSARRASDLMKQIGSPRLRIVLDPANLFETASPRDARHLVEEAVDLIGDRLVMAHAKDRAADGTFVAAGRGIVDFPHFVRTLRTSGFDGPLVTHGLAEDEASDVAACLRSAIEAADGA